MAKKQWWQDLRVIVPSIVVSVGALGTIILKSAEYILLPTRVEAVEQKADKIEQYIERQQVQNELLQQMITQDKQPILSPDKRYFYSEQLGEWRPIKEIRDGR